MEANNRLIDISIERLPNQDMVRVCLKSEVFAKHYRGSRYYSFVDAIGEAHSILDYANFGSSVKHLLNYYSHLFLLRDLDVGEVLHFQGLLTDNQINELL